MRRISDDPNSHGRGVKKPAGVLSTTSPEARRYLNQLSKAALLELVCAVVALNAGHCDDAPSIEELREQAEPVCNVRGDRLPRAAAGSERSA